MFQFKTNENIRFIATLIQITKFKRNQIQEKKKRKFEKKKENRRNNTINSTSNSLAMVFC